MSFNIDNDTITIGERVFDVDRANGDNGSDTFTIESIEGLVGEIGFEQYIESWMSPRSDVDGLLGKMVTWHRDYILADGKHDEHRPQGIDFEVNCERCEGSGYDPERFDLTRRERYGRVKIGSGTEAAMTSEAAILNDKPVDGTLYLVEESTCTACEGEGTFDHGPVEWAKREHGARVVLPLDFYEHSGITMSAGTFGRRSGYPFNCPWDSGIVGIIFDTAETREECGWENRTDEEIEADLRAEVEIYARFLEGIVTYYSVEDEETGYSDGCGGFIGWEKESGMLEEMFSSLENALEKRLMEMGERAEWAARDTVTT